MTSPQVIAKRYQVIDRIGQGGMGVVWLATDVVNGEKVAVKSLRADAEPHLVERFRREGEALRKLNHPGIVKILNSVEDDGQHHIIMEYVRGGSLADMLERQPKMKVQQALSIALDVADALTRAHRLEIIHRDVKPANVLLAEDSTPRLTDFGVAQLAGKASVTQTGTTVGTFAYLSPESLQVDDIDSSTDIWSFGVMLYEMLAGVRPFDGPSTSTVITAILTEPTPDITQARPDLPDALVDLLVRMLEKNRERRIPSMRLVGAELEAVMRGTSARATLLLPSLTPSERFATPTPLPHEVKHNLPPQPSLSVGRGAELAELNRLIDDPNHRLITLVGPGGIGKTHLALKAAYAHLDHFADGVHFVPLAPIDSAELVLPSLAEAVGFSFFGPENHENQLFDFLNDKHMLLLLDNFEHVTEAGGLVSRLLRTTPGVQMIATSRERLRLREEWLMQVGNMSFPADERECDDCNAHDYAAVALFIENAQRTTPGYEPTPQEYQAIARICKLVDGVPLAIELAAAWVYALSVEEIAAEIERSLDFLEASVADMPDRHRSIRSAFAYSWSLLTADERDALKRLSMFRGLFRREAAQHVSQASLMTLVSLVNKSLLRRDPDGRYLVHEMIRQYAEEKLNADTAECNQSRDRHSAFYAAFLQSSAKKIRKGDQMEGIRAIEAAIRNVRVAVNWMIEREHVHELEQSIDALSMFYEVFAWFEEGKATFERVVDVLRKRDPGGPTLADGLTALSSLSTRTGEYERAALLGKESVALLRMHHAPSKLVRALNNLSYIRYVEGAFDHSAELSNEACDLAIQEGDLIGEMYAKMHLGYLSFVQGDLQRAKDLMTESLMEHVQVSIPYGTAFGSNNLGEVLLAMGQYEEARTLFVKSHDTFESIGNNMGIAFTLVNLGKVNYVLGDVETTKEMFMKAFKVALQYHLDPFVLASFTAMAEVMHPQHPEFAVELMTMVANHHSSNIGNSRADALALLDVLREIVSEAAYAAAEARGKLLTFEEAVQKVQQMKPAARV